MLTAKPKAVKILFTRKQFLKNTMTIQKQLISLIINIHENLTTLDKAYKKEAGEILNDYNFNEMHCVDFIGKTENPNVTKLSQHLNLTRGAVSKIIKKLVKKNAIEIYTTESNKKEIYYKLTPTGQKVFYAHEKMHKKWNNDDLAYLSGIEEKDLITVNNFLANYNKFTESRIKILKGDNDEDTAD